MRRILSLLVMFMLVGAFAFAQNRVVTGTVTDEQGLAVEGASIKVIGTKFGTAADQKGNFVLTVPQNARLEITGLGITRKEVAVGSGSIVNITVVRAATSELNTVVVTALGIRRKAEEIGYSTARVGADVITAGKSQNLAQALSGKVSGLTIQNTSSSVNATPRIVLRGLRSITGDNTAMIVLDGVSVPANTINYLNPNDIERVDVMKGGQAATLFGSEGVNGAIVITTKKGTRKPEFTVSHSSNIEQLAFLPRIQTEFGSGSAYGSSREEDFNNAENQQYGPAYDGSLRALGRQLADGSQQVLPYSYIPGIRNQYWATGYTGQSDISYRAGDENSSFFLSFQHLNSNGIVPGDKYERNSFRMNSARNYGKINVSFDATYTFDKADRTNSNFYFFSLNSASWAPIGNYKDWRNNKFADPNGYFNDYYNNPWWELDNNRFAPLQNYFNGNVKLNYKASKSLDFTARVAVANTNLNQTVTSNNYTFSGFAKTGAFSNNFNNNYDRFFAATGRTNARSPVLGGNEESLRNENRLIADVFGIYNKEFGNVSFKFIAGVSANIRRIKTLGVQSASIIVPELYNFSNSANGLFTATNGIVNQRKVGAYGDLTLGFKGFAYLHGSYRQDYTSVFSGPAIGFNSPHFPTYGADVSLIITDMIPSLKGNTLDNIKLRASYNRNGNDNLNPYQLLTLYPQGTGFPYSGLSGVTKGNILVDPNLVPEQVSSYDFGAEVGLFKNRLTLEGTIYHAVNDRQILTVGVSPATGYTSYLLNAAKVVNKGYELDAKANIYRSKNLNINVNANYSYNTNMVTELYGGSGLTNFEYFAPDALASINATVGQTFPYLKTTAFARDSLGRVIISGDDGWPLRQDSRVGQGSTLPKHDLGLGFNISYKNLTFSANAEYRGGNLIYSDLGTDMTFTGSSAITAIYHRDQFIWPNSSVSDGNGKYVPNTDIAVGEYQSIYQGFGDLGFSRGFTGIGEVFVSSGAFWKLRDVSLSYDFPKSILDRTKAIKGMSVTFWGRNLITWLPSDNWYTDPEFSNSNTNNGQGLNNSLNTPPTLQLGATIKVIF